MSSGSGLGGDAAPAPAIAAKAAATNAPGAYVRFPEARPDAPLVVFDFDHTLYDGDSGSHLFKWLIQRAWWRSAIAIALTPLLGPMLAWLPTRRAAISTYVWVGTIGLHRVRELDALIDAYVAGHVDQIKQRLLPVALDVLHGHREQGDNVVIATGAPPELARAILTFVAHEGVPVIGTLLGPKLGAVGALRHCHAEEKMRMIRDAGYGKIAIAYSDSRADLPLLKAAQAPVVVNPKAGAIATFRRVLPTGTPILNWGCRNRGGSHAGQA